MMVTYEPPAEPPANLPAYADEQLALYTYGSASYGHVYTAVYEAHLAAANAAPDSQEAQRTAQLRQRLGSVLVWDYKEGLDGQLTLRGHGIPQGGEVAPWNISTGMLCTDVRLCIPGGTIRPAPCSYLTDPIGHGFAPSPHQVPLTALGVPNLLNTSS